MPEMPELENIRMTLEPHLLGRRIINVEVLLSRQIKWPLPDIFIARLTGRVIKGLTRKGKYLIMVLDNDVSVVFHLRMTGRVCFCKEENQMTTHARIILHFEGGDSLVYADARTLGTIHAMTKEELPKIQGLAEMGPEPLSKAFTVDYLSNILADKKAKIKSFLLDQTKIGGIGNIYADEALFLAKINPLRVAENITADEIVALHRAINKVIKEGIEDGGTTFRDYRDGEGKVGHHQEKLMVYGRNGKKCNICGAVIEKIRVGGRGTHFCPKCQR